MNAERRNCPTTRAGIECQWHIPESHYLETWSDAPAYDGTVSIIQPLLQPLYDSHSLHEILAVLVGQELRCLRRRFFSLKRWNMTIMDALTHIMRILRIEGQLYGRLEFSAPWGLEFPGDKGICLMVTRGSSLTGIPEQ